MKKVQLWTSIVFGAAAVLLIAGACALVQAGSVSLELDSLMHARTANADRMADRHLSVAQDAVLVQDRASASADEHPDTAAHDAIHAWAGHVLVALVTVFWIVISAYVISRLTRRPLDEIRQGLDSPQTELHPVTHLDERLREAVGADACFMSNAETCTLPYDTCGARASAHDAPELHPRETKLDPERIEHLAAEMRDSVARVVSLQMQTANVDTIVRTVNEVAEQMHLLALNAAIDAAEGGSDVDRDFAEAAGRIAKEAAVSAREIEVTLASHRPAA